MVCDEDPQGERLEVDMTTAERRRRRRRGAGLRVPSDNVPRSRTPTAPPPPVPEDPALAMSIAYSFTNDASGPVARTSGELPMAPKAMPTVIDPPSEPIESADFETQTREMTAVDLEALGLSADGNGAYPRTSRPTSTPRLDKTIEVDVTLDQDLQTAKRPAVENAVSKKVGGIRSCSRSACATWRRSRSCSSSGWARAEGVRQTRTIIVLSTSKEESFVPTGATGATP